MISDFTFCQPLQRHEQELTIFSFLNLQSTSDSDGALPQAYQCNAAFFNFTLATAVTLGSDIVLFLSPFRSAVDSFKTLQSLVPQRFPRVPPFLGPLNVLQCSLPNPHSASSTNTTAQRRFKLIFDKKKDCTHESPAVHSMDAHEKSAGHQRHARKTWQTEI